MPAIARSVLAVFLGAIVAGPIQTLPLGAFLMVLLAWALGTFAGSFVAARVACCAPIVHGMIISLLFLVAGIVNMLMIPHPVWM